jgi:hypothetical protein
MRISDDEGMQSIALIDNEQNSFPLLTKEG